MSFTCQHCGYQNNEMQSSSVIPEKGVKITLTVASKEDLNRQLVKSDHTSIQIPELSFEVPSQSQKGGDNFTECRLSRPFCDQGSVLEITTVEGLLNRAIAGLEQDQPARREQHLEVAKQIDAFICSLQELKELDKPFTLVGNINGP